MKHCILTTQILKDNNACIDYVKHFNKVFNGKATITTQNLHKAAREGFPVDWLTKLLPITYWSQVERRFAQLLGRPTPLTQDYYDLCPCLNEAFEQAYPDGEGFPPVQEE
jgi:hypothetical protein